MDGKEALEIVRNVWDIEARTIEVLKERIDMMIYDLYGLTDVQKKTIEILVNPA